MLFSCLAVCLIIFAEKTFTKAHMNELRQIIKQQAIRFPSSFVWYSRYRLTSGRRSKAGGHSRHPWCRRSEVSCTIRQRCGDQIVEGAVKGRKKASRGRITWQLHPFTEQYLPPPTTHTQPSKRLSPRAVSLKTVPLHTKELPCSDRPAQSQTDAQTDVLRLWNAVWSSSVRCVCVCACLRR